MASAGFLLWALCLQSAYVIIFALRSPRLLGEDSLPELDRLESEVPAWVEKGYARVYATVLDKVRAWLLVTEGALVEVDYSKPPKCSEPSVPYINFVVHIVSNSWTVHCGVADEVRGAPLVEMLNAIAPRLRPEVDVYIPFGLHDGVQAVREGNQHVPVLGPVYHESYSRVNLPIAMGCIRSPDKAYMNTLVVGWNDLTKRVFTCNSTAAPIKKAVFRGKANHRRLKYGSCCGGSCAPACNFTDNGRLYTHFLGEQYPQLIDAAVSNVDAFHVPLKAVSPEKAYVDFPTQLCDYRAILNIGNNVDWAERLRQSFYGNAVVMLPERPPHEFFTSFMEPWKHYWPIAADLSDVVEQVEIVVELRNRTMQLDAQKEFAGYYLTEEFMLMWNQVVIEEYYNRVKEYYNTAKELYMLTRPRLIHDENAVRAAKIMLNLPTDCQVEDGRRMLADKSGQCPPGQQAP